MTAAARPALVSVEDYLAGELVSSVKHEYLGGYVYAMAGAKNRHNLIAVNILAALHSQLRGKPCRSFNSDTKVRIRLPNQTRFYYTDTMVVCRPNAQDDSYQDEPVVIVEIISRSTRRTDEGEKKDAYLTIPSLSAYLLVEQEMPAIRVHRRTERGFVDELIEGMSSVVPLPEIGAALALADVFEGIEFSPETDDEDAA